MSKVRELLGLGPNEQPSIGHVEGLLGLMDVVEAEKDDQIAVLVEALKRFSMWLEQECTRGTLDLGFGPDWSARKVELALDRLLADLPAAARERAEERERLREALGEMCCAGCGARVGSKDAVRIMDCFRCRPARTLLADLPAEAQGRQAR